MRPERASEEQLPRRIWQELRRAPEDRHHEWRTPVLATVGLDGLPQARTVVLREAHEAPGELVFFTDARSPKCAELRAQPGAVAVFWSGRLGWQLRASGVARLLTDGAEVQAAWERVRQGRSARDYLGARAPGAPLDGAPGELAEGEHHFAMVRLAVRRIDWLELHRDGHRRAVLEGGRLERREP